MDKRESWLLDLNCTPDVFLVTVSVMWLILAVPWDGLQCVIVVLHDYTLTFYICFFISYFNMPRLGNSKKVIIHDFLRPCS